MTSDSEKSRNERLKEATGNYLAGLPPDLEDAAYRCFIVRWFNAEVLAALLEKGELTKLRRDHTPSDPEAAQTLYEQLQELMFIEERPGRGYTFHDLTRQIMLEELWQREREFYSTVSELAANYFLQLWQKAEDPPPDYLVEFIYHFLIVDEAEAQYEIEWLLNTNDLSEQIGFAHGLLQAVQAHADAGRLSSEMTPLLNLWQARVANLSGNHTQVEKLVTKLQRDDDTPLEIRAQATVILAESLFQRASYQAALAQYELALNGFEKLAWPEDMVIALMGQGDILSIQGDMIKAQEAYGHAMEIYIPLLVVPAEEETEETEIHLLIFSPNAWQRFDYLPFEEETKNGHKQPDTVPESDGLPEDLPVLYFVEMAGEESDESEVQYWPVAVTGLLAELWLKFGYLSQSRDEYDLAAACGRLAGSMFADLDDPYGTQRAVELLRSLGAVVGDLELRSLSLEFQRDMLEDARELGDRPTELSISLDLATHSLGNGEYQEAGQYYQDALLLAQDLNETTSEATALDGLARLTWIAGDYQTAEKLFQDALDLYQQKNHREGEANLLLALGDFSLARYQYEKATDYFHKAKDIFTALHVPDGLAKVFFGLARVATVRFVFDEATAYLNEALTLARGTQSRSLEAKVLMERGAVNVQRGAFDKAEDDYQQAHKIVQEIPLAELEARILDGLGELMQRQERYEDAIANYHEARQRYQELQDPIGELQVLSSLLWLYEETKDATAALKIADEVLPLARRIGDRTQQAQILSNIALTYNNIGNHKQAIALFEEAIDLDEKDPVLIGNFGWGLYLAQEYERSIKYSKQAIAMDPEQTWFYRNLGHAYLALRQPNEAKANYQKAINLKHEGEHFKETIKVIEQLLTDKPDLPRGEEFLAMFKKVQAELDAINTG